MSHTECSKQKKLRIPSICSRYLLVCFICLLFIDESQHRINLLLCKKALPLPLADISDPIQTYLTQYYLIILNNSISLFRKRKRKILKGKSKECKSFYL